MEAGGRDPDRLRAARHLGRDVAPEHRPSIEWRAGWWLAPYLLGLHGPVNDLHFGWDVLVMALFSLAVYLLAVRLPRAAIEERIGDLTAEAEAEEAAVALPTP